MRSCSVISAVVLSLVAVIPTAKASSYFVSTSGNDANPGTLAAPFRTINKAASLAHAGDIVTVRGGVYNELVNITAKGTATARISFQAYTGETPVVDGTGLGTDKNLVTLAGAAYVDFSGFEVRNATRIGICGWGAQHISVTRNTVHDSVRNGIYFGNDAMGVVNDIDVENNTVYNNVLENQNQSMSGGWSSGIMVSYCSNGTIRNNKVYQNYGEGIIFLLTNGGLAELNDVHDNFSVEIYLDNARTITVNRNFAYSTGQTRYYRGGMPAAGIGNANESYSVSNPSSGLTITNNIVVNSKWGFYYGSYGNGGGLQNTVVADNTFYKATAALLWIDNGPHSGNAIEDNIFDQVGASMTSISGSGISFNHNLWYGGTAGAAAGVGDVIGDPRLANAGGTTSADYKLLSDSPASGKGLSLSTVTSDYLGFPRGTATTLGAYELGLAVTPVDSTAPSVPAGLTATAANSSTINVQWSAATDNVGVAGYYVSRDGARMATVTSTSWSDSGLAAQSSHSYAVAAYDAAGNVSPNSATASATTPANAPTGDTQAPTVPTGLYVISTTASSVMIAWNASADNTAVAGYHIYRDGVSVATVTTTSWTDTGLAAQSTHQYAVSAFDAAGNTSARSATLLAVTQSSGTGATADTQAPSAPTTLYETSSTTSTISMAWNASTDNVSVTGYRVYRDGVAVATASGAAWTDSGLTAGTTHQYKVLAFDAAGNQSAVSNTLLGSTSVSRRHAAR